MSDKLQFVDLEVINKLKLVGHRAIISAGRSQRETFPAV